MTMLELNTRERSEMRVRTVKTKAAFRVNKYRVALRNLRWRRFNKRCREDWGVNYSYTILVQFSELRTNPLMWNANTFCAPPQMSANQRLVSIVRNVVSISTQQTAGTLPLDYTKQPLLGADVLVMSYQSEYNRV